MEDGSYELINWSLSSMAAELLSFAPYSLLFSAGCILVQYPSDSYGIVAIYRDKWTYYIAN